MKEHAWKLTPAARADAHQIPRTHFVWSVGHRRYLRRVRFRIVHIAGRREIRSEGLDAFQTANELAEMSGLSSSRFDVTVVGVRKHVKTSQGFTVAVRPVGRQAPECVVVHCSSTSAGRGATMSGPASARSCPGDSQSQLITARPTYARGAWWPISLTAPLERQRVDHVNRSARVVGHDLIEHI